MALLFFDNRSLFFSWLSYQFRLFLQSGSSDNSISGKWRKWSINFWVSFSFLCFFPTRQHRLWQRATAPVIASWYMAPPEFRGKPRGSIVSLCSSRLWWLTLVSTWLDLEADKRQASEQCGVGFQTICGGQPEPLSDSSAKGQRREALLLPLVLYTPRKLPSACCFLAAFLLLILGLRFCFQYRLKSRSSLGILQTISAGLGLPKHLSSDSEAMAISDSGVRPPLDYLDYIM